MPLIDAEELQRKFCDYCNSHNSEEPCEPCDCITHNIIKQAPTIDAAPVVHGRWEDKPTGRYGQQQSWCSVCRKPSGIGGIEKNRHRAFCPNCGARMDM